MKTEKDFADFVRMEMKSQQLKDTELARMADVNPACIWGLCNGYNMPRLTNVIKILHALGYDLAFVEKPVYIQKNPAK